LAQAFGRPAVQLPEPERLWIRYSPRAWPPPSTPWIDLAAGRLGRVAPPGGEPAGELLEAALPPAGELDDTVYLPPVPEEREEERRRLATGLAQAGVPVVLQLAAGAPPPPAEPGVMPVIDLLPAFLAAGPWPVPLAAPDGGGALWPLLPGLSDAPEAWRRGLGSLAGFAWVQGIVPELTPGDRRRLVEQAGDEVFDALYLQAPAEEGSRERAFAAAVAALGPPRPSPFASRPEAAGPSTPRADNRRLAAALLFAGTLWLRLGRSAGQGQAFFRAARWVDRTSYPVAALAREGNLAVIEALDPESRRLIADLGAAGLSPLLAELEGEYLAE
jgi:hypothetical protein